MVLNTITLTLLTLFMYNVLPSFFFRQYAENAKGGGYEMSGMTNPNFQSST